MAFVLTTVALAFGLACAWRENVRLGTRNSKLETQNKEYRNELGIFEIAESDKIHAIRIETDWSKDARRYRVFVPRGTAYELHYAVNSVPRDGLPTKSTAMPIVAGEHVISFTMERMFDRKTGEPIPLTTVHLDVQSLANGDQNGSTISIVERDNDWIVNKTSQTWAYSTAGVERRLRILDAHDPLVLLRLRALKIAPQSRTPKGRVSSWSSAEISTPCDGFIVWIRPAGAPSSPAP